MSTHTLNVDGIGSVELTITDQGAGQPVLLLHGGAGPQSFAAFAEMLAKSQPVRVIMPTHPGFNGTPRPESLNDIRGLARTYDALLKELGLTDVTVVGNSVGGWIAAELALLGSGRVGRIVLSSAGGIEVPEHPIADISKLSLDEIGKLSYHAPEKFRIDPAALPPERRAMMAGNRATLVRYAGNMIDPTLLGRLSAITVPTLVLWGEADRIFTADYGRAYGRAIPGATFRLLPATGHMPQVETPQLLATEVWGFVQARTAAA